MSQLTRSGQKTFVGLLLGNLLIILALFQLIQYYYDHRKPMVPPRVIQSLTHLVQKLQSSPQINWPGLLEKQATPWSKITLSEKPLYADNALLKLNSAIVFDLIKSHQKLEMSVFIAQDAWLNIKILSPFSTRTHLVLILLIILFIAFFFINYWAVKTLNQPIQTVIQSLNDNKIQDNWVPIPLTGNADQRTILKKINELQSKVSKLLSNRTRVVTAISHDLRTPLTRLKLRTEYLSNDINYEKMINDINEMEVMIRETLDYFHDIHTKEKLQRFDLVAMLNSLQEDALELREKVTFKTELKKLVYTGAVNLLKRAFNNIINNAVSYGGAATIQLSVTPNTIEIIISDTGPGLSQTDLEEVFTPFYRGENSRSRTTGGTGLGLTIAKEIIQMHQGSIILTNPEEGGLKVFINLPVKFSA
ncbi:ATP-binding protein [Legionella maioricensis]|uniref:histidine kinase n=1 Tax=Legionella maioricensis TaxID=2896528 RepID=A0A9X2D3E9_9GAMM|nr:ATP-binding protein [Legionella maioricensis]MCL9685649.1 sensor histidine kinase [Legionella maioricensis]MCL9689058.1 ATP-binding protein [Legionella maioricensis]